MKIPLFQNYEYLQSFKAKNQNVRKADDLQRKTRQEIPFFSPRYAKDYYSSCSANTKAQDLRTTEAHKLDDIRKRRKVAQKEAYNLSDLVKRVIKDTRKTGLANCGEASLITMSILLANGFPDTHRCALILNNSIFEKETGEEVFSKDIDIDHACVICTMDKNFNSKKPYIVLDSWNGFADGISGSRARYIQLIPQRELEEYKDLSFEEFRNRSKTPFDKDRYEIKQTVDFTVLDSSNTREDKQIRRFVQKQYPALIVANEKKKKD